MRRMQVPNLVAMGLSVLERIWNTRHHTHKPRSLNLTFFLGSVLTMYCFLLQCWKAGPPRGWPLCLEGGKLVLRLGEVEGGALSRGDCYLCLRPEAALVWREGRRCPLPSAPTTPSAIVGMASPEVELSHRLRNLLVSVERAFERIPLSQLAFPCSSCGSVEDPCPCSHPPVVEKRDSCIQTSPIAEMDASIRHIDSDDEHDIGKSTFFFFTVTGIQLLQKDFGYG